MHRLEWICLMKILKFDIKLDHNSQFFFKVPMDRLSLVYEVR